MPDIEEILGKVGGAGVAGLAAYYGKQTGQEDLRDIGTSLQGNYADVRSGVQTGGEFRPYTVTSGAGGASFNNGQMTLDPNATQQGLTDQANTMLGGLSTGVTGLGNLGDDAFGQANQAMFANSGLIASQLGGMYGQMGQQQIANAAIPQNLSTMQDYFSNLAMGGATNTPSLPTGNGALSSGFSRQRIDQRLEQNRQQFPGNQQQGQSLAFGGDYAGAGTALSEALRQGAANATPNPNAVQLDPYERGGALYGQPTREQLRQSSLANQQQSSRLPVQMQAVPSPFNGGSADVADAFSGIAAPNVNNVAGGIGQQAIQGMNFGTQAQDVSGMFGGIGGSPFQTSTAQDVQNLAMGGVEQAGQFANVGNAFAGINAPNVRTGAGSVAGQALGQADFGAQAQDVSGAYSGISAPNISNALGSLANQALGQANLGAAGQDVSGMLSGIAPSQFSGNAGQLANQALGQADLGAQAQNVQGAFAGIEAPSVRTGSGEFGSGLLAQAQQALQAESPTASSIFDQIRATQQPEEERQRIALENRLAAQGRLGVSTAAYGGTPEQLAMEKAQAEARNNASYQAIQQADQLATSQQARAAQLGQMGLSAEQVQAQLDSEGFGQQMQLGQSRLSEAQTQEALQSSVQQRQAQLAQLGLSAQQIQAQLESEGFSQQMQLGQANIGAQQAQSQLDSESQNRASQLAQLGMSAEQIASQLQSEGLSRQQSSAQLASQIAQTGAGISAQQQQLGQSMLGLGLQSQELGGQLNMQDLARAQGMFGMGQQSAMMPSQLQGAEIANIGNLLQSSNIPYQQQLAAAQMGLGAQQSEADRQMQLTNLLANVGLSEAGLIRDLGLGESTLTQEYIKSLGNIGAGVAGIDF
jgi:hypothetical protein